MFLVNKRCVLDKKLLRLSGVLLSLAGFSSSEPAWSGGVSPYLPLNISPTIERQIERVMILAGRPVMRRPIPAANVLDALPKACAVDAQLCEQVRNYLARYTRDAGVTELQVEAAIAAGQSDKTLPNAHGMSVDSPWKIAGGVFYQPSDYLLLNAGGVAYQGRATPTGTSISLGLDVVQLDIGYRDHWFSPLTDSSMLISTEAPTMPSITLSNYKPISPLGFNYEIFLAEMSKQDNIAYFDTTTSGRPRLAGLQLGIEPVDGYSLAINRLMQYGGGARNAGGFSQFKDALFKNSNRPDVAGQTEEFGNQVASITSSILFPGKTPFAVHAEYAGEDNAYEGAYRLGATDLSVGIDFPKLFGNYDLTYEASEWQNVWYTHHLYPDGLTNHGHVLGHWFGDQRLFGDAIGGSSHMLRLGWSAQSGAYWQAIYRQLAYDRRWAGNATVPYETSRELSVLYSTQWKGHEVGASLGMGRDVFGKSFARLAGSFDLATTSLNGRNPASQDSASGGETELFVDAGAHRTRLQKIFFSEALRDTLPAEMGYHFGFGARRAVSKRNDLGVRLEVDRLEGHTLWSLRMLDYRYRFTKHIAANTFVGVGRYEFILPAHGYYMGAGIQYMNVLPGWDVSLDYRRYDKLGRDKVLVSDPPNISNTPRLYFDISGVALYASRRF